MNSLIKIGCHFLLKHQIVDHNTTFNLNVKFSNTNTFIIHTYIWIDNTEGLALEVEQKANQFCVYTYDILNQFLIQKMQ